MKPPARKRFQDFILATASAGIVVGGIAWIDDGARGLLIRAAHGELPGVDALTGVRVHNLMRTAVDLIRHDHPEVAAFVLIGIVLFVGMFKL